MYRLGFFSLLLLNLTFASTTAAAAENLTAHFIDVDQGDSILLQFNGKSILIDGGPPEMGPRLEEYLKTQNVSHLDLLVLTHPHDDHFGGLIAVLEDLPVKKVIDNGENDSSLIYKRFRALIEKKKIAYAPACAGQEIDLDPALKIKVLWPPQGGISGGAKRSSSPTAIKNPWESIVVRALSGDMNQHSLVLRLTYGRISFLLMADADTVVEKSLVSDGNLSSQILKVGHHGGTSASSPEFLEKVRPAVSIISVGEGNYYGYPTERTLDALQAVGSRVYRTDTCGSIKITTDGLSYSLISEKNC